MSAGSTIDPAAALAAVLAYENEGVLADVGRRYCLHPPRARLLFEQVLRWVWLLERHRGRTELHDALPPARLAALLERPLSFIAAVGECFVLRTREYAELCERAFGHMVHWPARGADDPPLTLAELRRAMELVYDELGEDVVALWFHELASCYRPEHLDSLRLYPTHKSPCEVDAACAALGLAAGALPDRLDVVCAVSGRPAAPVRVSVVLHEPRLVVAQDALTPGERLYLVEQARGHTMASQVRAHERDASRTSESWRAEGDDPVVTAIQRRLATLAGVPVDHAEPLQVNRYAEGAEFKPHHDNPSRELLERQGLRHARLVSAVAYLDEVQAGGETWFPYLGVRVLPVPGTVLLFHNFTRDGREDLDKKHAGCRVRAGEKWIATQWFWSTAYELARPSLARAPVSRSMTLANA